MAMLGMSVSGGERRVALALLCACAVALTHAHDKRAESESVLVSPIPFTFAARYGRSPERHIAPRNDRWLMTTRYGKRSELTEAGTSLWPLRVSPREERREERVRRSLSCEYTGILSLFRCSRMQSLARIVRRRDNDPVPSGEELTPTELTHHYAIATL